MTKAKLLIMLILAILLISACKSVAPASEQSPPPPAVSQPEPSSIPSSPPAIAPAEPVPTPTPPFPEPTPPPVTAPAPTPAAPVIPEGFNVGNRAIDFELQTLDGQTVKLSDLRGKPVLINFWATWCGPCKAEMPFLQQVNDTWKDKGLVVLAIDLIGSTRTETPETVKKFMSDLNLSLIVPLDEGLKVTKANAITAIPTTFLIDKDGIIRSKRIGAFPNVETIERELTKIMPVRP